MTTDISRSSYVYVLTNPAMPGMVKIGRTSADDPADRASSLYTTGVPLPFEVEFAARVEDMALVESVLHNAFRDSRVNPKREFFRIEPDQVIRILELLNLEDATEEVRSEVTGVVGPDEQAASDRYKSRRPVLNFEEMGIPTGSVLTMERDASLTVEVVEPRKVFHDGEAVGLSRATRDLLGLDYYVAPTRFWLFKGRSLNDIYNETYPVAAD